MVRGSRRARHVAANTAAAAAADGEAGGSSTRHQQRQQLAEQQEETAAAHAHAETTPVATATSSTTTTTTTTTPVLRHGPEAVPQLQPYRQRPRQQHPNQVTPRYSRRTPDQQHLQDASSPVMTGPAPHPFRLHRTAQYTSTRLSMPYDSDESSSEPDLSVLAMTRARHGAGQQMNTLTQDEEALPEQAQHEVQGASVARQLEDEDEDEDDDEDGEDGMEDEDDQESEQEEPLNLVDPADVGLKEISNLGRFTVSSHKPGNGVEELRSDDLKLYWQSDGPQPHKLTVYFVKRVGIRDIRFFVDYNEDESYTPTKIVFKSGTSENSLIEFATVTMDSPVGWQQVPIAGTGGEPDGNTLVSYVLQMQILENHQNGKDTHLRGIKIYAFDADAAQAGHAGAADDMSDAPQPAQGWPKPDVSDELGDIARSLAAARLEGADAGFVLPDFMKEPEIR